MGQFSFSSQFIATPKMSWRIPIPNVRSLNPTSLVSTTTTSFNWVPFRVMEGHFVYSMIQVFRVTVQMAFHRRVGYWLGLLMYQPDRFRRIAYTLSHLENDRNVSEYSGWRRCHRGRNLCVFSRVQKGTPGLTYKGCVLQRVFSDVTIVLGMRQSIGFCMLIYYLASPMISLYLLRWWLDDEIVD